VVSWGRLGRRMVAARLCLTTDQRGLVPYADPNTGLIDMGAFQTQQSAVSTITITGVILYRQFVQRVECRRRQ